MNAVTCPERGAAKRSSITGKPTSCSPCVQCAHPALAEVARMLLIDAGDWIQLPGDWNGDEVPTERLATESAYKPRVVTRLRFTAEFKEKLRGAINGLYSLVHQHGEIMPIGTTDAGAPDAPRRLQLVKAGAA